MYTTAILLGILGFLLCFVSDTLPLGVIIACSLTGAFLMIISYVIILKHHEKSIKYIKLHFIDGYGNHRYVKAYTYAGKYKAIHDMKKKLFTLYTAEEVSI